MKRVLGKKYRHVLFTWSLDDCEPVGAGDGTVTFQKPLHKFFKACADNTEEWDFPQGTYSWKNTIFVTCHETEIPRNQLRNAVLCPAFTFQEAASNTDLGKSGCIYQCFKNLSNLLRKDPYLAMRAAIKALPETMLSPRKPSPSGTCTTLIIIIVFHGFTIFMLLIFVL